MPRWPERRTRGAALVLPALAVQPDGKVLVAGGFDFVNGALTGKLQRLNPDGTTDATFNAGGTGALASASRGVQYARGLDVPASVQAARTFRDELNAALA